MENQKILLVTGKGGVGKSTVAAAVALKLAQARKRVLLAEVGEKSFYKYLFGKPIDHEPVQVLENLWAARWEGEACLYEYIAHLVKIEKIVSIFFENKVMKALIQAAPALKELAIIGKLTSGLRKVGPKMPFDYVIMDAYATGHFKALISAPKGMGEAIPVGPMGDQCRSIETIVQNPNLTRVWIVSLPEELPVTESLELSEFLKNDIKIQPQIILNRVLTAPLSVEDCETLKDIGDETNFISYLCAETIEQDKARKELAQDLVAELPNDFSHTSIKLLKALAERMPYPWSTF